MAAFSSKGTRILLSTGGAGGQTITVTEVSNTAPVVVTAANSYSDGELVRITGSGFPEVDGKLFLITGTTGSQFTLQGSDASGQAAVADGAGMTAENWDGNMSVTLCLSSLTINPSDTGTIAVPTFCDPSASLPSSTSEAGTLGVAGYVDKNAADYLEMLEATQDGQPRLMQVVFPDPAQGRLVAQLSFGQMSYDVPIDGAPAWSATGVLASPIRHIY